MVRSSKSASKLLSRLVLAAAVSVPVSVPAVLFAQDAGGGAATPALSPVEPGLRKSADDFWHYVQVARYELASAEAKKLVEGGDPLQVLKAFQSVASERKADLDTYVARWKTLEAIKEPATQLAALLEKGGLSLAADQGYVEDNIKRLIINERAYQLAVGRLRQSGELAVPLMVQYLRSADKVQYHGAIRRALTDMGKYSLSPLLAATEAKEPAVLLTVVNVLADQGYESSVPYLLRLSAAPETAASVRAATAAALGKLGASRGTTPADAFQQLGERFYYDKAQVTAQLSQAPVAYVWYWSEDRGLTKVDVAPAIFNELMAMRAAEYALGLDRGKDESLSLWLAANYKREVELPAGATDATRAAGQPDANYYGYSSGARYLNDVLARTLKDNNSAVALRAVRSLQSVVGQSSLFAAGNTTPLTAALSYPDKVVRFEAAYAIGSSIPMQPFAGAEQVVPILAEGIAQTGKPGVVVIGPSDDVVNKWVEELKAAGYNAAGGSTADAAVNVAASLPSVDAVVISEDVGLGVVDSILAASNSSPRLGRTPKVILTKTTASPYASRAAVDVLVNTTQATETPAVKDAIDKARARAGANPLDEAAATASALRALTLLQTLAVAKSPALDLLAARPALIAALNDARPEIIKAAGTTLALIGQREGQVALINKALDAKTPDDLKVSLLKSASVSAKTSGNLLSTDLIAALEKVVETGENLEVRSAAAEARGALNLPPQEAKGLIVGQSRK